MEDVDIANGRCRSCKWTAQIYNQHIRRITYVRTRKVEKRSMIRTHVGLSDDRVDCVNIQY